MYVVIDFVLKNLLEALENKEGKASHACTYNGFITDEDLDWVDGVNAGLMFGQVKYQQNEQTKMWKPMILKLTPSVINFPEFHAYSFINEAYFYTRMLPYFQKMRPLRTFPKFYTSYIEMNEDDDKYLIVFESLKTKSYKPSGKKSFLDYDHLKLMMQKLGELHAYSYKALQEDRDHFRTLTLSFKEVHFTAIKKLQGLIPGVAVRGLEPLRKDPKYATKLDNVEKTIKSANGFVSDVFVGDRESPLAVMCHGDYVQGNMLFKYDDETGKPVDMKIVDLASAKLASPIVDLALILYLNADQQMRDDHWDDLINDYYSSLSLTFPGVAPPKAMLLKEFATKALYAYFLASYFLIQSVALDKQEPNFTDLIPNDYKGFGYSDIPMDVLIPVLLRVGGDEATKALADILKDMIDRGFI